MNRLGHTFFTSMLAVAAAASLAACGGGGSHSPALPHAEPAASSSAAYTGPLSDATFKITIPAPTTSGKARHPAYVSSSTSKIVFTLNSDTVGLSGAALAAFNASSLGTMAVTLGSAQCPGSGPWTCTFKIDLPPGTDNLTVSAQDASSNVLSQQVQSLTVVAGNANSFSTTLDANALEMTVTGSGFCAVGTVANASTFGSVGTQPVAFFVAYTDPATKTIVGPGLPILSVNGHTNDNAGAGYTIIGSGGNVNVKVTQSTQSYVLTPSTSSTTATIDVSATPANTNATSDGLGFNTSTSYTFATGPAPPSHNFLAAIEQTGANSGQVDLFNLTIGATSGSADTFSAFSPATLAVTGSTNQAGVNDVDNPLALAWDVNGDLLIANGGGGNSSNHGNFACIPAGSIATGSAQSTTVTTNVNDPVSLAYGSHGTVALADGGSSASVAFSEYMLSGNYTAADGGASGPGHPNLTNSQEGGAGGTFTTFLPTLSSASDVFAVALFGGAGPTAKVTIVTPAGETTDITDSNITNPVGLAWDAFNAELVIANNFAPQTDVLTYKLAPNSKQQTINTSDTNYYVAAAPDGKLAVAGASFTGTSQVFIYSSAVSARTLLATIPFNATTTSCGATYVYNPGTITSMSWLSPTKLLISLNARNTQPKNGLYIFDISATQTNPGFDDITCNPTANGPKQTGFAPITNQPLGTAFRP